MSKYVWFVLGVLATSFVETIVTVIKVTSRFLGWVYGWALTVQWYIACRRAGIKVDSLSIRATIGEITVTSKMSFDAREQLFKWARS